jgi:predicted transcriptional regulator
VTLTSNRSRAIDATAEVAKAKAAVTVAEHKLLAQVQRAHAEGATQAEIATVLSVSQPTVHRILHEAREAQRPQGQLGADPYEIAQRYAVADITRQEMLDALIAWPYEPETPHAGYWDDVGIAASGGFSLTVGRALDNGLISDEDYDTILRAIAD